MKKRISSLWRLTGKTLEALLIVDLKNIRYLCGFTGSEGTLLLTRKGGVFFTDGRYSIQAKQEIKGLRIVIFKEKWKSVIKFIKELRIDSLGIESNCLTVDIYDSLKKNLKKTTILSIKDSIRNLRIVKQKQETKYIEKASKIAYNAFLDIVSFIKPGIKERDLAVELEYRMKKRGAEDCAFNTIVASGIRAALPHATPTNKRFNYGELVVIDFGAVHKGYCSDETVTVGIGKVNKELQRIYQIVKDAHDKTIDAIKPGKKAREIDNVARDWIKSKGYGRFFTHATGHGLGLDVHEPPVISAKTEDVIEEGMVFTVEPGIYIPRIGGIRIEDVVLVTKEGAKILTLIDKRFQTY